MTKHLPQIGRRFIRKAWLWFAFEELRNFWSRSEGALPSDEMKKPDVHGEFADVDWYHINIDKIEPKLRAFLESTLGYRDAIARWFSQDSVLDVEALLVDMDVENLLAEVRGLDIGEFAGRGIGEALAESGKLPMYGMPTRTRDLYTGFKPDETGRNFAVQSIDRDLEIAIQEFAPGSMLVKDKRRHLSVGLTGSLAPNHRLFRGSYFTAQPFGSAFARPFWLIECPNCGAWKRVESADSNCGDCEGCGAVLEADSARECIVPNGFRTELDPCDPDAESEQTTASRTALAEGTRPRLAPVAGTNLAFDFVPEQVIYRLNRGSWEGDPVLGRWAGFEFDRGTTFRAGGVGVRMVEQWVDPKFHSSTRFRKTGDDRKMGCFLAAPKVTDSLVFAPRSLSADLKLDRFWGDRSSTGIRAAAISANFLLVHRAAKELDVAPEEFEVLEPRRYAGVDETAVPLLQICDTLVNGSGLCNQLVQTRNTQPFFAELIESIVRDTTQYPLSDLVTTRHRESCDQSCYRCLCRFGNQPWHGLLDWRLGLDYLEVLLDPDYRAGVDGSFESQGLKDWPELAARYAKEIASLSGQVASKIVDDVWLIQLDTRSDLWAAVVHPFWDWDRLIGIKRGVYDHLLDHPQTHPISTFDASRRMVTATEWIRGRLANP